MSTHMAPEAIEARLREASRVTDLFASRRLDSKIDLSPKGIEARLLEASAMLDACLALSALGSRRPSRR